MCLLGNEGTVGPPHRLRPAHTSTGRRVQGAGPFAHFGPRGAQNMLSVGRGLWSLLANGTAEIESRVCDLLRRVFELKKSY